MASNRIVADQKVDDAREKIRQWGAQIARGNWDWHLLGHAVQYAHEAIENDPAYQRPWTILADIYHRIGKIDLARKCLKKSYSLATPGPNFPGRFYREVERNLTTGYPFNSFGGISRETPPSWFEERYERYWVIIEVVIKQDKSPDAVAKVFMSYVKENNNEAERLRSELLSRGFAVWKDTYDLNPGERWKEKIQEALEKQDFVVVCLSRVAVSKIGFFQVELKEALERQRYMPSAQVYLIPIKFEECELPRELREFHCEDLFPNWENGVERVATSIRSYYKRSNKMKEPQKLTKLRTTAIAIGKADVARLIRERGFNHPDPRNIGRSGNIIGTFHPQYELKTVKGDKIVFEQITSLIWQHATSGPILWEDGRDYINQLNMKQYAGYSDWRLPTIEELLTLLEADKKSTVQDTSKLYLDSIFDNNWTSAWSVDANSDEDVVLDSHWGVDYGLAVACAWSPDSTLGVRAIRSI